MADYRERWTTVRVEVEEEIAWVILNRPEKCNAMSPTLNREMHGILETLESDGKRENRCPVFRPMKSLSRPLS